MWYGAIVQKSKLFEDHLFIIHPSQLGHYKIDVVAVACLFQTNAIAKVIARAIAVRRNPMTEARNMIKDEVRG